MALKTLNGVVYTDDVVLRALPAPGVSTSPSPDNTAVMLTPALIFGDEPAETTSSTAAPLPPGPAAGAAASEAPVSAVEPMQAPLPMVADTPFEASAAASPTPPADAPRDLGHMLLGGALLLALLFQVIGLGFIIKRLLNN